MPSLDTRTIRRAQRGNATAQAEVCERMRQLFLRWLSKQGIFGDDQEEIISCAMFSLLRQLPNFRYESSLETWGFAILLRVRDRYLRKRSQRQEREVVVSDLVTEDDPERPNAVLERAAHWRTPDHLAQLWEDLEECLGRIPVEMRDVWVRHRLHHQQHHEIAEQLGISINTVSTRVFRVDRKLRPCLERKGHTPASLGTGGIEHDG